MVYGCKVWAKVDGIDKHASSQIKKLEELQTKALRRITGAYKCVPAQVLQQEADIPPMDLYIQQVALDQSKKDKDRKATEYTREASQKFQRLRSKRARTGQRGSPLYQTRQDKLSQITLTLEQEVNTKQEKQGWMHQKWNQRWEEAKQKRRLTHAGQHTQAARTDRGEKGRQLHKDWTRPQSTMATLIRTEHIGLNAYLTRRRVPGKTPECSCGNRAQTPKHVVMFCPMHQRSKN